MKIDFGMIIFNGLSVMPRGMLKANLDNIYSFANIVHISEGAVHPTKINNGDATWASKNGSSTDGTIEFLQNYSDPDNKIKLYTKNGFYDGKLEMIQKWKIGGDYIWITDGDEFYHKKDMEKIITYLEWNRDIDRVDFYANQFFGDFHNCCDGDQRGWSNPIPWQRLFRYKKGDKWKSATPYILMDKDGRIKNKSVLSREMTGMMNIFLYHYAYVCESQAEFKKKYYNNSQVSDLWHQWQLDHNIPLINGDRTKPFLGKHPKVIEKLLKEIKP